MSTQIGKFKLEEKIRLSFLKHRGNLGLVADECGIDLEYVDKVCKKIKRKQQRDVSLWVSSTIAEYLLAGSEQRRAYLIEILNKEIQKPPMEESVCCGSPIDKHTWDEELHSTCKKCGKDCEIIVVNTVNEKLVLKLIEQLRAEDDSICEFVVKLGFTNREDDQQAVNKTTNYNLLLGDLSNTNKELLGEVNQLDPRSRESLRKQLEGRIVSEAKFEDGKNEQRPD